MNTTYQFVYDEFKDGITDPDLLQFAEELQSEMLLAIMRKAISKCNRIVKKMCDLNDRNDLTAEFNMSVPDDVLDVLLEWMTVIWLKPYVNNIENLKNNLNTKDFTMYSPANLLEKIGDRYDYSFKYANSLANKFSYIYGDLENLKS
jgi:hypothetical protein